MDDTATTVTTPKSKKMHLMTFQVEAARVNPKLHAEARFVIGNTSDDNVADLKINQSAQ